MAEAPGRCCPISYRYDAKAFAGAAALETETLWVAGGLYGNRFALACLLELFDAEPGPKALVFNGDFHWFDADAGDFAAINAAVLRHRATRGNVETELVHPAAGAGCGCAYPDWVDDASVARSNRILERLRAVAQALPRAAAPLGALPMTLVAEVGGERVGIVHGDAGSLAGWAFSEEALATASGSAAAREALARAALTLFASSHSCLPVLQCFPGGGAIVNNGAAGMPNFAGTRYGVATRISVRPRAGALYRAPCGALSVEARAIDYDHAAWRRRFRDLWPEGSDAWRSYGERIARGPRYALASALRPDAARAAQAVA
jgi:hypothetical protein